MKKKIKWSEYIDPTEEFIKSKQTEIEEDDDNFDDEDEPNGISSKLLNTPVGMTTVGGPVFISKYFHVWILDTNFDIIPEMAERVDIVPGVEGLQVVTRYKMRIGIPKTGFFDVEQVKKDVEDALLGEERQASEQMDKFISQLFSDRINFAEIRKPVSEKYDTWAIYILPNGKYEIVGNNANTEEFKSIANIYLTMQQLIGGKLITNEVYE